MLPYPLALIEQLSLATESRILLVVLDGVGDLPRGTQTPLAAALTPNLDRLAAESALGLSTVVVPGISPGSGPGHLSLFGYDPLIYQVGRGVLSGLGLGLELGPDQIAVRGNFATLAADGTIADRRAGRIPTTLNNRLISSLKADIEEIEGVKIDLYTEAEYRFVLVLTGRRLGDSVTETDPGAVGELPLPAQATTSDAADRRTAAVLTAFAARAAGVLAGQAEARRAESPVNAVLLRGIGKKPELPDMRKICRLRAGSVAAYPMYRGVSRLVGMQCLPMSLEGTGERTANKMAAYRAHAADYELIYFHVKKTDSCGEDGDFAGKTEQIELFDEIVPGLLEWEPDVVLITGDHSTPVALQAHSWHPLPVMLWSRYGRPDRRRFTESECLGGSLGRIRHLDLMPLAMAHARKLKKFGA